MNERTTTGIVLIAAFVVGLGVYAFLPSLQSSGRSSESHAARHAERARRLLERYTPALVHNDSILDVMRTSLGLDVDLEDEGSATESAQRIFTKSVDDEWEAFDRSVAKPGALGEGIRERNTLVERNEAFLADALAAANEALSADPDHAEAHRIKGAVLYHLAMTKVIRASSVRNQSIGPRMQLASLATQIRELEKGGDEVKKSGLEARIADCEAQIGDRETKIAEVQKAIEKARADLAAADGRIAELEGKLAGAQERAAAARAELDVLRDKGVDLSRADGGDAFADAYAKADQSYRSALREAQAIERGTYPHARIDRTGDLLGGAYEENGRTGDLTVEHGLEHHRSGRAVVRIALEGAQKDLELLQADVEALRAMKTRYAADRQESKKVAAAAREKAKAAFEEFSGILAKAAEIEGGALADLKQSAAAAQTAAAKVDERVREATRRSANLSPEAKSKSAFEAGRKGAWVGGYVKAQAADAELAQAWVHYQQSRDQEQLAMVLEHDGKTIQLAADAVAAQDAAENARVAGLQALTAAMKTLQAAHREAGQPWTITAQAAGATYLAVLLGAPNAESYLADAVEAYRAALAGREDEPYVAKIQERLAQLEKK